MAGGSPGVKEGLGRAGVEIVGWILIPVGIVMMPAPGPGTLVLLAGVAILAQRYAWARRVLDWLEHRAIAAARFGVATWPRIAFSALGCAWLVALGALWWISPEVPEVSLPEFTLSSGLLTTLLWLGALVLSAAAIVVLRGLARSNDLIRIGVVVVIWAVGLWFAVVTTPVPARDVVLGVGPQLPAAGWGTAVAIWASAALALGLLVFSIVKWREPRT